MDEHLDNVEPSEVSHRRLEWRCHLKDVAACADRVQDYTAGLDRRAFVADSRTYDATLRNLSLIASAAVHFPVAVREAYPDIPWRTVIEMRDRLNQGYLDIDDDMIWNIVKGTVPALSRAMRELSTEAGSDS